MVVQPFLSSWHAQSLDASSQTKTHAGILLHWDITGWEDIRSWKRLAIYFPAGIFILPAGK